MNGIVPEQRVPAGAGLRGGFDALIALLERIPHSFIALLGRVAIAGIFWKSGQTKVEGLAIDLFDGRFQIGWPRLAESAVDLFRDEYRLPLLAPELAATLAAFGEHTLPLLLLLGLGTRFAALGLLAMTAVIQVLVYPGAWPTHGVWAAVLLWLVARGAGVVSVDHGAVLVRSAIEKRRASVHGPGDH